MIRLFLFLLGFCIFFGCLALSGWLYEHCIEVSEWWHDLVGFMDFPLFGIGFILWMILVLAGLALMGSAFIPEQEFDPNEVKE